MSTFAAKYTPPKTEADKQLVYNLDNDYPKFTPKHTSLMAMSLTEEAHQNLVRVVTPNGYMLQNNIIPGVNCADSKIG